MSYTPTTWAAGDTVTAAKLNKLEQGVASGGGVLVVHATVADSTATYDKTWKEINDSEVPVFIHNYSQGQYFWDAVSMTYEIEGSYQIATFSGETVETDSENGNVFVPVANRHMMNNPRT